MAEENGSNVYEFPNNDNAETGRRGAGAFLRSKKGIVLIICLAVLIVALIAAAIIIYNVKKSKIVENNDPDVTMLEYPTSAKDACFGILGDTYVIVSDSAVTGLSKEGVWKWNYEGTFSESIVNICGERAVVLQSGKNDMILFTESGFEKRTSVEGKVLGAGSSGSKLFVTFAYENGEYGVSVYDTANDSMLMYTRKYSSAYMMSASMSSSGSIICASGANRDSSGASSVLSFIRNSDGEVYATETEEGTLYPIVRMSGDTVFAANTDTLKLIKRMPSATTQSDKKKTVWERNGAAEYLISIAASKSGAAAVRDKIQTVSSDSIATFYSQDGEVISERRLGMKAEYVRSAGDRYLICSRDSLMMFSLKGECLGKYDGAALIKCAEILDPHTAVAMTDAGLYIIDFGK
ncbi:MAG: hypothetical protein II748_02400 [Clostridia bacterium]|nr:hypothetical protein [Clostridia bacterium]